MNKHDLLKGLEMINSYLPYVLIPTGFYTVFKILWHLLPGSHQHKTLQFKDKTVLIIGASSGLGASLAFELYKSGAKLILTARRVDNLKELCENLKKRHKGNPYDPEYRYLDIANVHDVESLRDLAIDGSTIHVLINNSGISMRGSVLDTPVSIHRRLMETNYFGHVAVTRALLPAIPDEGCIIATSSVQGKLPVPYRSAYTASKHAFQAFFDTLRCESRPKLHILVVSAGYINTGFGSRALNTEGIPVGEEDENQSQGMSAEYAAHEILRAASARETDLILAPISIKLAIFLRWACPTLLFYILYRRGLKDKYAKKNA